MTEVMRKLYEEDEVAWRERMVELIESGQLKDLDFINIAVTLIEMGRSDLRSVTSLMKILILHLLKWRYQPTKRSRSWTTSIVGSRGDLGEELESSERLKDLAHQKFDRAYALARDKAAAETGLPLKTFPPKPQFGFDDMLRKGFLIPEPKHRKESKCRN